MHVLVLSLLATPDAHACGNAMKAKVAATIPAVVDDEALVETTETETDLPAASDVETPAVPPSESDEESDDASAPEPAADTTNT